MGLYDRDYYQREQPGYQLSFGRPQTMVVTIIIINVVVWLAAALFSPVGRVGPLLTHDWLAVHSDTLVRPWMWWQFVTYGFCHSEEPSHIFFNMLALWFLGRDVEQLFGRWEFLRIYLAMLAFGGLVWGTLAHFQGLNPLIPLLGASGAVAGVVVLFALYFPKRTILLFFVLPMPAWLFGALMVFFDMLGATQTLPGGEGPVVAYSVHLAGAAFALAYAKLGWNFGALGRIGQSFADGWKKLSGPKLKVHQPGQDEEDDQDQDGGSGSGSDRLNTEVDRILEKISREGEASLTRRERKTLQDAARRYQERR